MSLLSLAMKTVLGYQERSSTNFSTTTSQPGSSVNWTSTGLSLTTWNNLFLAEYVVWVTAPTLTSATSDTLGGSLGAGTYYYVISGVGPNGPLAANTLESAKSNEHSATLASTGEIVLVWPALQGAVSYNIYRGTGAGTENVLVANTTALTYTDTGAATTSQSPPSTPNTYIEFNLGSFSDLLGNTVTPGHILQLIMIPTGTSAIAQLAPGTSNGLTWFFGGTTPTVSVNAGGVFFFSDIVTGTGTVIDSTHKTLRITNTGSGNLTVQVGAVVGP